MTYYATLVQNASIVEAWVYQSMKEIQSKNNKFKSKGGGAGSRSFPSRFNRGVVSQLARPAGFKRIASESVGQGGGQSRATLLSQPRTPIPDYKTCGKRHLRVCNLLKGPLKCFKYNQQGHHANNCSQTSGVCFECGKAWHMWKDCPMNKPTASGMSKAVSHISPTAETFNMTIQDAVRNTDMKIGYLLLNLINANVLFDSRAMKLFIFRDFGVKLNLKTIPLFKTLEVETTNHKIIPIVKFTQTVI